MNFEESKLVAKQLAERALSKGFDTEAFIVLSLLETSNDLVPESTVDENIDSIKDMFVIYMRNRTIDNFKLFLNQTHQMLSELYNTTDSIEERKLFSSFIENLYFITK